MNVLLTSYNDEPKNPSLIKNIKTEIFLLVGMSMKLFTNNSRYILLVSINEVESVSPLLFLKDTSVSPLPRLGLTIACVQQDVAMEVHNTTLPPTRACTGTNRNTYIYGTHHSRFHPYCTWFIFISNQPVKGLA